RTHRANDRILQGQPGSNYRLCHPTGQHGKRCRRAQGCRAGRKMLSCWDGLRGAERNSGLVYGKSDCDCYSQEVGRAGRDGKTSQCVLFLLAGDRSILENFARGNTPSRESVRAFVARVCNDSKAQHVKPGDILVVNTNQYAKEYDIRDVTLGILFAQLELKFKLLRAVTPMYMVFEYKTPDAALFVAHAGSDTSPAARTILSHARLAKIWYHIDVDLASGVSGVSRTSLVVKLNDWHDSGWIELKATQRRNRYQVLKDMPDDENEIESIADQMFEKMVAREKEEVERLEKVFAWASTATCLPKALAEYFGDIDSFPLETTCGHCTACQSGGEPAIQYSHTPPPFNEIMFQQVLAAIRVRDDPRFLARVAYGITSPRITAERLSKHPVFGSMCEHPWDELLKRCEMEVEAHQKAHPDGQHAARSALSASPTTKRRGQTSGGSSSQGGSPAKRVRGGWKK
ncbi:hypothetical protein FRC00_010810, partial [Tulasnella sp. 408]